MAKIGGKNNKIFDHMEGGDDKKISKVIEFCHQRKQN